MKATEETNSIPYATKIAGFCPNTKTIFIDLFSLNQSHFWFVCYTNHLANADLLSIFIIH